MAPAELSSLPWRFSSNRQEGPSSSSEHGQEPDQASASDSSPKSDGSKNQQKPEQTMSKLLGEKKSEWQAVKRKEGPLHLLDLPVDILNLVIKEVVMHTNDLIALALTHSALHRLTIPQIYSRFDIVWPDTTTQDVPRSGVDALTYGLATLVMAEDVFGESPSQRPRPCLKCGHDDDLESNHLREKLSHPQDHSEATDNTTMKKVKRRRGNYYAEFTKKFSLGNGPEEWNKEYLANSETGKMLGTLVALAIARMRSLETFIWNMPTGILPDVWNALASLGERDDGRHCRLERVWVRWHNNSPLQENKFLAEPIQHELHSFWQTFEEVIRQRGEVPKSAALDKRNTITRPNFSMLPPLKGLNVLDIDECSYLDEMSVLISESRHCLKELRVGIADHAVASNWAHTGHGERGLSQLAEGKSRHTGNISALEKRLGGVLGVLTGYIFDLKKRQAEVLGPDEADDAEAEVDGQAGGDHKSPSTPTSPTQPQTQPTRSARARFVEDLPPQGTDESTTAARGSDRDSKVISSDLLINPSSEDAKLRLENLALERVSISVEISLNAFDWTTLKDLTLLDCQYTASLWSLLRRNYTPASEPGESSKPVNPAYFALKLRRLHTNTVTPMLLGFLRETLAPNSLEVLFLQQSEYHLSKVTPEQIMNVIKRHRGSLRKILVDSSERDDTDHGSARAEGFERWQFNRSMLNFITSGKMPNLRELGIAISHKDWHYLLQRLPAVCQLRALYLTYIANPTLAAGFISADAAKEHAYQVLDILTIRPDIELCYLAITTKCFEIVESRVRPSDLQQEATSAGSTPVASPLTADDEETEGDEDEDEDSADGADDEDDAEDNESEAEDSLASEDVESETEDEGQSQVKMDLKEILWYDEKIAIFKARHGRL